MILTVILNSGKTVKFPMKDFALVVSQLDQFLSSSEDKMFTLFMHGRRLQLYQTVDVTAQDYVLALQVPAQVVQTPSFTSKEQAFQYLEKEGISRSYLQSTNVDPQNKKGLIKNILFTNHMTKTFVFRNFQGASRLSQQQKKQLIQQFVTKHVLDQDNFGESSKETAEAVIDEFEQVIKLAMN